MTETTEIPLFLIDTHCHLDVSPLEERLDEVLSAARSAGVRQIVVPGVSPKGWSGIAAMTTRAAGVFPAFGLHPMHAGMCTPELLDELRLFLPQAVAVGEIGLDYLLEEVPRAVQLEAFRCQLRMAVQKGLPVLIHCRKAFRDLLAVMKQEGVGEVGGIMHAFSGSPEVARECLALGMCISVAGPITYPNAVRRRLVVEQIPLSHLVLETDAPDLTPEPYRGRANEPVFLPLMAEAVAGIKGVSYEEVVRTTTANAMRILGRRLVSPAG
jgi:TatD DNase family protein